MNHPFDAEAMITIFLILVVAGLVVVICGMMSTHARQRRHDLRKAREPLDAHFDAMEKVLENPDLSQQAKRLFLQFSTTVNQREAARAVAMSIIAGETPQLSPKKRELLERVFHEIQELAERRHPVVGLIRNAIEFGFAAMVVRWPETEYAMADVMVHDASADEKTGVKEKAARVIAEIPEHSSDLQPVPA
jgi:hypothetical protein